MRKIVAQYYRFQVTFHCENLLRRFLQKQNKSIMTKSHAMQRYLTQSHITDCIVHSKTCRKKDYIESHRIEGVKILIMNFE